MRYMTEKENTFARTNLQCVFPSISKEELLPLNILMDIGHNIN